MTECVTIGDATLYLGDCRDVMPKLRVHRIFTDPPYEAEMHNAESGARGRKSTGSQRRIRIDGHANPPPLNFASIDGVREVVTPMMVNACSGYLTIFCTPEGIAAWRNALEAAGARYKRACFWYKPDSAPQFNGQGPAMAVEPFVTAWCGHGISKWSGGGRRNLFTHNTNQPDREGTHPTEKPLRLMAEIVTLFSEVGQVVCDPFMGSGTTGVACIQHGRSFVGIEKDPEYFEVAVKRIQAAVSQPRLPIAPTRTKQERFI